MSATAPDWSPETYARFRGLRLRPALDLLAQVGDLPPGDVIDLGCGDGAVAGALAARATAERGSSRVDQGTVAKRRHIADIGSASAYARAAHGRHVHDQVHVAASRSLKSAGHLGAQARTQV